MPTMNLDVTGNEARRDISPIRKNARSARSGERDANPLGTNLHVKGLSRRLDNRDLLNTFSKAGRVQKAQIILDPHTRESRGYGFVTMESAEEALAAIQLLNATELHGKLIAVEKARRGRARTPTPGKYLGLPRMSNYEERLYDPMPYDSRYSHDHRDRGRPRDWRDDDNRSERDGRRNNRRRSRDSGEWNRRY
ncbi:hypothetical protein PM082_009881 [Marasmius tenuissimus]|nr:hypothetical protein PM082_009881 [Marasmius tenuissimus]